MKEVNSEEKYHLTWQSLFSNAGQPAKRGQYTILDELITSHTLPWCFKYKVSTRDAPKVCFHFCLGLSMPCWKKGAPCPFFWGMGKVNCLGSLFGLPGIPQHMAVSALARVQLSSPHLGDWGMITALSAPEQQEKATKGNLQSHLGSSRKLRKRWCYWKLSRLCGAVWLTAKIRNRRMCPAHHPHIVWSLNGF